MYTSSQLLWHQILELRVLRLFGFDPVERARKKIDARDADIARDGSKRFARGNISIQRGRFQMPAELDAERERAAKTRSLP